MMQAGFIKSTSMSDTGPSGKTLILAWSAGVSAVRVVVVVPQDEVTFA
jgi:hypothetical protein